MSFTLVWSDGLAWSFSARTTVKNAVHYHARVEHQLKQNVYILRTIPSGLEPSTQVVLKMARDAGEVAALELEARFYANELKTLQGTFVPFFYGIYHGVVYGVPVACMLLEYCTEGKYRSSPEEKNRRVMVAACALHQGKFAFEWQDLRTLTCLRSAGVMHCDLDNGRQFVLSGRNVKIVDFSVAVPHRCSGATPTLHGTAPTGCKELLMLEERYGI
ncbi:hypothetical protein B0H16DRAFT_1370844, partial [Mycena metata]